MKTLNFKKSRVSVLLPFVFVLTGFSFQNDDYIREIENWHKNRIESLKKEDGWLNLAGLFWLEEGTNTFGSDPDNQIIFPKGKSDGALGELTLKDKEVWIKAAPGAGIFTRDDLPVTSLKVFPYDKPVVLKHKSLRWTIIKRGDQYGVRLRDLESDELKNFQGIETFPIDPEWKIKARFIPTEGRKVAILDVLGHTSLQDSPGRLLFTVRNKSYSLDAVGTKDELFIIFGDKTNKKETYGSGKFLYASVDSENFALLDFNKSYNPPCAFTPYATCPLPPRQNILNLSIRAGEKNYSYH